MLQLWGCGCFIVTFRFYRNLLNKIFPFQSDNAGLNTEKKYILSHCSSHSLHYSFLWLHSGVLTAEDNSIIYTNSAAPCSQNQLCSHALALGWGRGGSVADKKAPAETDGEHPATVQNVSTSIRLEKAVSGGIMCCWIHIYKREMMTHGVTCQQ